MYTRHARVRMQQRCIPEEAIELLEKYGSEIRSAGADHLIFDKSSLRSMGRDMNIERARRLLEPWRNISVCMENGRVITAYRRIRRLKRKWSRRHNSR